MNVSFDPAWPWSLPRLGFPAFTAVALLLLGLTLATYLGVRGITWRRLSLILALRLAALAVTFLLLLRPSFGWEETDLLEASKVVFTIDDSESMSIADEFGSVSRWRRACDLLDTPAVRDKLQDLARHHKIEAVFHQASDELRDFVPTSEPKGVRTDLGFWLHDLPLRHAKAGKLRGLAILTDGIDNGVRFNTLDKAGALRNVAPLRLFGVGKNEDNRDRRDIVVTRVVASPSPAPIKTKMTIKAWVQSPGFEGAKVDASLWMQSTKDKMPRQFGKTQTPTLKRAKDQEIAFEVDAPEEADEYKVTVKIAPRPGEASDANNEADTYVNVTKDGIRILIVDGKRRYETLLLPQQVLAGDSRFRVSYLARLQDPPADERDPYEFEKTAYDVIVLGDLSAKRFAGSDNAIFDHVLKMVREKKTGLLMLGGFDALGNGRWDGTPLAEALPVMLDKPGQVDRVQRMVPTTAGLAMSFFRLKITEKETRELFDVGFLPFEGYTPIGTPKAKATVLAESETKAPMMATWQYGAGRVVVFGPDTTWKAWRYSPDTLAAHGRFWKQLLLWLAQQEDSSGQLWVNLETRRLAAGSGERLGITFGLRDKKGDPAKNAKFQAKVVGPTGQAMSLATAFEQGKHRSHFVSPSQPGEYRVVVQGEGDDSDGGRLKEEKSARFVVVQENLEMQRVAADHDSLARLAAAAGGKFQLADETALLQFLNELQGQAKEEGVSRTRHWPDWRRQPLSPSIRDQAEALWGSATFPAFLLFAALLSTEWGLRRWWDLV